MRKRILPCHVEEYRDGFRYRRKVPGDVREKIGKASWTHNFKPDATLAHIEGTAKRLTFRHDREIAVARGQDVGPVEIDEAQNFAREWLVRPRADQHEMLAYFHSQEPEDLSAADRAFLNALDHGGQYVPEALPLAAALERDKRLYGQERDPKPLDYAADSFVKLIDDKPITSITRGDVSEWLAHQAKDGLSPATIKRRLGALRAVINRAFLDFDYSGRNPFERHRIKNGDGGASDRVPFNVAMIERIDSYCRDNKRLGHETRNILMIMKGTGGGPAEIGGLVLSDVSLDGEIPYVWIRANALRGLKTGETRDRQVPLVGDAMAAARDAVKRANRRTKGSRKNADQIPLFGSWGINGRNADSISAKLNKAIRKAGVPKSKRLTAYSFRHTVKEALRSAAVVDHVQRRLMGHAGQGVADRYGSPRARLAEARDALTAAMEHLGDVDSAIYTAAERIEKKPVCKR